MAEMAVAAMAARQHGVVSVGQLHNAGIEKSGISRRVRSGRLHRLHRGVYAVGHRADSHQRRWMAAVLACGEGAVLSHGSAAALWGFLRPIAGPIHVSVPTANGRVARAGIHLHRRPSLTSTQFTYRRGIPVTTAASTIDDLRGAVPPRWFRRAVRQAEVAGVRLGPSVVTDRTRSDVEGDFLALSRRYDLPVPEVNVRVGRWTVDFLWRRERLAVETDSYRWHRGRVAFEDDHARDLDLNSAGFDVRRFTGRQIAAEPGRVAAVIRDALATV